VDEIERYIERRDWKATHAGKKTPYGRQWAVGWEPKPEPEPELEISWEPLGKDEWIGTRRAALNLNVDPSTVRNWARCGKLQFRWDSSAPRKRRLFNLAEVMKLRMRMDEKESARSMTPEQWKLVTRRPNFCDWKDFLEGDRPISTIEAASILNVRPATLRQRFRIGRLFVWRGTPEKPGNKWFFSEKQIRRYAADPLRLERRERWFAGKTGRNLLNEEGKLNHHGAWLRDRGLLATLHSAKGSRDYGEEYSSGQAARVLGVSVGVLQCMRRSGRLKGVRRNPYNIRSYWFFKKSDVHALQADPKRHAKRKLCLQPRSSS
jgi:predicted site-specific integrase-resolvase